MKHIGRLSFWRGGDEGLLRICRYPYKKPMIWQVFFCGWIICWYTKEWKREQKRISRAMMKAAFMPSPFVKKLRSLGMVNDIPS